MEMRRAASLHHLRVSFKLLGYMLKHAEMGDREIDSVRENRAGLDNAPDGQACLLRWVYLAAGGVWREGVCCRQDKFLLAPQAGWSLTSAKTLGGGRSGKEACKKTFQVLGGWTGREVTGSQAFFLLGMQPFLLFSSSLFWHNTKREEKHYCIETSWKPQQEAE